LIHFQFNFLLFMGESHVMGRSDLTDLPAKGNDQGKPSGSSSHLKKKAGNRTDFVNAYSCF